jgi:hypothetical protein
VVYCYGDVPRLSIADSYRASYRGSLLVSMILYSGDVGRIRRASLGLGILLALAGCGSSTAPVLTVSCSTRALPSGAIRARVIVTNVSSSERSGVIYGPALSRLTHIYPVLRQAQVLLVLPHQRRTFIGYALPTIRPKKSRRLLMRFAPGSNAGSLVVTDARTIHAGSRTVLTNRKCMIKGAP